MRSISDRNVVQEMLPPDRTTPILPEKISIRPHIAAASAHAPPGSTTVLVWVKQAAIASTISASVTVTTWSSPCCPSLVFTRRS
ncbi:MULTISPECIES: hypothetical protein [unclassified Nonomuraea]|uniref:hypothetical protein n=1 Tax=unclassified Nonomuraea TaxID=2593643 RepID=UPI0035C25BBF